ncbi:MAG TPA: redoxin domain-containing protein [Verrucomicrobiae bacterium]|nr:redoxin domain-containing protein [Verrucomicrobiae bacterium]
MELAALEEKLGEFRRLGAALIAISPQLPEHSAEMSAKLNLSFPVLSDAHNEVARRFGIVFRMPHDLVQIYESLNMDVGKFNGDDSWELALPARYVIDAENVVRSVVVNFDYTYRPEPLETIAELRSFLARA